MHHYDKAGIASAVLCTLHCLLIPALFLVKFSLAGDLAGELPAWWGKLDYVFLLISFWAVYHAATHTRITPVKISLWFFWGVLAVAIIFEAMLHQLAYLASAGLVTTHVINMKMYMRPANAKNKDDHIHMKHASDL